MFGVGIRQDFCWFRPGWGCLVLFGVWIACFFVSVCLGGGLLLWVDLRWCYGSNSARLDSDWFLVRRAFWGLVNLAFFCFLLVVCCVWWFDTSGGLVFVRFVLVFY